MNSIENLTAQLLLVQEQRKQIFEQIQPLQEKSVVLYEEIKAISEAITVETLKSEQSEQARFDFLMAEDTSCDMIRHKAADSFIQSLGLYMNGQCLFSKQRKSDVFIFKLAHDRNTTSIDSIKKLVEMYKPMDEDGNKIFRVFCQDYYIFCHPDGTYSLRGRYNDVKKFNTLEELFADYVACCVCHDDEDNNNGDD